MEVPSLAPPRGPELRGGLRDDGSGVSSAGRSRSPARPATSRRRRSARRASRPATRRSRSGRGRSCSRTPANASSSSANGLLVDHRLAARAEVADRPRARGIGLRHRGRRPVAARRPSASFASSGEVEAAGRTRCRTRGGVVVVPAFVGLGAPYWDPSARGAILGLTRVALARRRSPAPPLNPIAYQVRDVVDAMDADMGSPLAELRIDGGGAGDLVCSTPRGPARTLRRAAGDARDDRVRSGRPGRARGRDCGRVSTRSPALREVERRFVPAAPAQVAHAAYRRWQRAVERARGWAVDAGPDATASRARTATSRIRRDRRK